MNMYRELVTDPLTPEDLWNDLTHTIETLKELDISHVLIMYGFSWGTHYYDGVWKDIEFPLEDLLPSLQNAVEQGIGAVGHDNLYITIPQFSVKLQYSHETDIRMSFGKDNGLTEKIRTRWQENGWLLYGKKGRNNR